LFLFFFLEVFKKFLNFSNVYSRVLNFYFLLDKNFFTKFLFFIFGHKALGQKLVFPKSLEKLTFDKMSFAKVYKLVKEKNLCYVLFNFTNNGEFFYDDNSEFLLVQQFKHSVFLEFI